MGFLYRNMRQFRKEWQFWNPPCGLGGMPGIHRDFASGKLRELERWNLSAEVGSRKR